MHQQLLNAGVLKSDFEELNSQLSSLWFDNDPREIPVNGEYATDDVRLLLFRRRNAHLNVSIDPLYHLCIYSSLMCLPALSAAKYQRDA